MPDGLFEKVVAGVLRALTGLIIGSGSYQLFDGHWFGETIFRAYLQSRTLDILTAPSSTEMYGLFAAQSIPVSLQGATFLMIAGFFFVGLVVLAHVMSKPTIAALAPTFERPRKPAAGAGKTAQAGRGLRTSAERLVQYIQFIYVTYQPLVTLLLFVTLTGLFFGWPFKDGLALVFLIAVVPAALYLLLYPTDLSKGGFLDRFTYVGVLALLVVTLFGWPQLYGTAVFDPDFPIVSAASNLDHCDDAQLLKGPSFVAFEKANEVLLFRVCFDRSGQRKYVDFFGTGSQPLTRLGRAKLSDVIATFVRPVESP